MVKPRLASAATVPGPRAATARCGGHWVAVVPPASSAASPCATAVGLTNTATSNVIRLLIESNDVPWLLLQIDNISTVGNATASPPAEAMSWHRRAACAAGRVTRMARPCNGCKGCDGCDGCVGCNGPAVGCAFKAACSIEGGDDVARAALAKQAGHRGAEPFRRRVV